jgi:type IV secretory pathway VirB10-like protein
MEECTMVRLAVMIFVLALFACGDSDTGTTGDATGAAPMAATSPEGAKAPEAPPPAPAVTANPQAQSCLDLIGQAKFQQALPICIAALEIDPSNQQLEAAVETARAESASLLAAEAAGQAAVEGAAEDASAKLGEAAGGAAGGLGR